MKEGFGQNRLVNAIKVFFWRRACQSYNIHRDIRSGWIALKKGHKDFVVIVSSHTEGQTRVLGVLPDRKKETVVQFLNQIPDKLKATIESVATDMYEGYLNAAKESLGEEVEIVIDRFHVAQTYRNGRTYFVNRSKNALAGIE